MRLSGVETTLDTSELPEKYFFLRHYAGSDEDYQLGKKKNQAGRKKPKPPRSQFESQRQGRQVADY